MKQAFRTSLPLFALSLALVPGVAAAQEPQLVELDPGEQATIPLRSGKSKTLKLISVREFTEPYFESATGKITPAVVRAELTVEVDGVKGTISGGPFRLPATVNGLALLLGCTRNWAVGIAADPTAKAVRLEAGDASVPWVEPGRFAYPIRNYRWHAMNYQHTYLGLAVNQARLYYHRGEDMGMIPDRDQALAIADSEVKKVPGPQGDGGSNSVVLDDGKGLIFRYAHMNTPQILPHLVSGTRVNKGEPLGLTGNTWRGGPVRDPHLHVEAVEAASGRFRHSFPMIVAAYRASFPGELMPVAGGWRHLLAGERITLDGSLSLAGEGRQIKTYEWIFSDGSKAKGRRVERRYGRPGTYSEQLVVTDHRGTRDSDFVEVFVLTRDQKTPPPFAWINYYPVRGIRPGTDVEFLTRYSNMKDLSIDYGDGTRAPWAETTTHQYQKPGTYIVTVRGADAGAGEGVFRVRVIVE